MYAAQLISQYVESGEIVLKDEMRLLERHYIDDIPDPDPEGENCHEEVSYDDVIEEEIENIEMGFRKELEIHIDKKNSEVGVDSIGNVAGNGNGAGDDDGDDDGDDGVLNINKAVTGTLKGIDNFCEAHPIPQREFQKFNATKLIKRQKKRKGEKYGWTEQEELTPEEQIKIKKIKTNKIKKKTNLIKKIPTQKNIRINRERLRWRRRIVNCQK